MMLNQLLLLILEVSITTSAIILIVKILSFFINKRYAAKWKKWVWLIIAVRLIIPIDFSFYSAPIQVNIPNTNDLYFLSSTTQKSEDTNTVKEVGTEVLPVMADDADIQAEPLDYKAAEKNEKLMSWVDITIFVWGFGCIAFAVYYIVGYLYFRKQILRWSRALKDQNIHNIITDISSNIGIKRKLDVYVCDKIASPSLMGFINPIMVIPSDFYSDEELTFIFKHELTHYRRHDLWYKLLLLLANAVHWFNPSVYLLRHEACIDLEFSCDEEVIKGMSVNAKKAYGETILSCINQQKTRKTALTTCFSDTTKTLKERLQNILSTGKKKNGLIMILMILFSIVTIGTTVGFADGGDKQNADGEFTWYGEINLIPKELKLPEELIKNDNDWNKFLESDAAVALVADIPEEDIYVYGLKENGREKGTYTLHGICVRQGDEIQVLDISWGVYGEIPKLQYEDYDNDGIKELALITRGGNGTNMSLNDLYILERNPAKGWKAYSFGFNEWGEIMNDKLEYKVKDGILTIAINGEDVGYRIDLKLLEEGWGEKLNSVSFGEYIGSYGEFYFKDGKIYLQVLPTASVGNWATPQIITDDWIHMEVLYNQGFELKNAFNLDKK